MPARKKVAKQPVASKAQPLHDPQVLRAISHPLRGRILDELSAAGTLRAADVAQLLDVPANQASFHLRQLAKWGLIVEAPEEARDGRDRVWKPAAAHGYSLRIEELEKEPGGAAIVSVWRQQASAWAHDVVEAAYAPGRPKDVHSMISEASLKLSKEEAAELADDLSALVGRWQERTVGGSDRRTYHLMQFLQPYPERAAGEVD